MTHIRFSFFFKDRPFDIKAFCVVRESAIRCIALPQGPNCPQNTHKQHYRVWKNNITWERHLLLWQQIYYRCKDAVKEGQLWRLIAAVSPSWLEGCVVHITQDTAVPKKTVNIILWHIIPSHPILLMTPSTRSWSWVWRSVKKRNWRTVMVTPALLRLWCQLSDYETAAFKSNSNFWTQRGLCDSLCDTFSCLSLIKANLYFTSSQLLSSQDQWCWTVGSD